MSNHIKKINGKYAMLHRPKEWIGEEYGVSKPAVWIRFSDDMLVWNEPSTMLIDGIDGGWEEKVGGSTPPLKTDRGWLVLYHGVENGGLGYYRVGVVMLDLEDPTKIIKSILNIFPNSEIKNENFEFSDSPNFSLKSSKISYSIHPLFYRVEKIEIIESEEKRLEINFYNYHFPTLKLGFKII